MLHPLDQRLDELKWFNARLRKSAEAFAYETVGDLLTHYPRRYEDRRKFERIPGEATNEPVCLHVEVVDTQQRFFGKRRRMFEASVRDAGLGEMGGRLTLRWFNLPYIQKIIAVDQELVVHGKIKLSAKRLVIDHPDLEVLDGQASREEASVHMGRITPVYPLKEGVAQRTLRAAVFRALDELDPDTIPDLFSAKEAGFGEDESRLGAMREIHFPTGFEKLKDARRYLAFEEFFGLQLRVAISRAQWRSVMGAAHCGPGELLERFLAGLPFKPTNAQRRAIGEIQGDLASTVPMNRLLQGDVGSGKTLVALAAVLLAVESGCQAAIMAPTQILAEQHCLNFRKWLDPLGVRISLRTGAKTDESALPLFSGGEESPQIVVGTHALLYDKSEFENLGLIVIDEQHKFGVAQRGRLQERGEKPDVLVMTATPIPRTLTMTVYGDLDVSVLDELPAGRGKIVTAVREAKKTPEAAKFVREQIEEGRQAYIVYPLVEESEKLNVGAVKTAFEEWRERIDPHSCAILHGRLAPEEKEKTMAAFREGETKALVATTVIEVGVDVANANVMLIYDAERFGLAQLHQLRGRIGRGTHKSYCIVMTGTKDEAALEKLRVFESTADGFVIAEEDLRLRGPGDVLGTAQSGLGRLKLGDLVTQTALVKRAADLAKLTIAKDPDLADPANARLAKLVGSTVEGTFAEVS